MGLAHLDIHPDPESGRVIVLLSTIDGASIRLRPTRGEAQDLALRLLRAADALPAAEPGEGS